MSATPTRFATILNEGSTGMYTVALVDDLAVAIGTARIDALTLSLANKADGATVNGRSDQDALNANNVTVSAGGVLVYTVQPLDSVIVDPTLDYETHVATFKLQYDTNKFANWDVEILIRNLAGVS